MGTYVRNAKRGAAQRSAPVPTGIADKDTAIIQDLAAAAFKNKTALLLGPGEWRISSPIKRPLGADPNFVPIISGQGDTSTVIRNEIGGGYIFDFMPPEDSYANRSRGGAIRDIGFTGTGANGDGILLGKGMQHFSMEGCSITGFSGTGKLINHVIDDNLLPGNYDYSTPSGHVYRRILIDGCDKSCVFYFGDKTSGQVTANMTLENITATSIGSLYLGGGQRLTMRNIFAAYVYGGTSKISAIKIEQGASRASGLTLDNCQFEGCHYGDFDLQAYGAIITNWRSTGNYQVAMPPESSNISLCTLGSLSRGSSNIKIINPIWSYGVIYNKGGDRVSVTAVDPVNVSDYSVEGETEISQSQTSVANVSVSTNLCTITTAHPIFAGDYVENNNVSLTIASNMKGACILSPADERGVVTLSTDGNEPFTESVVGRSIKINGQYSVPISGYVDSSHLTYVKPGEPGGSAAYDVDSPWDTQLKVNSRIDQSTVDVYNFDSPYPESNISVSLRGFTGLGHKRFGQGDSTQSTSYGTISRGAKSAANSRGYAVHFVNGTESPVIVPDLRDNSLYRINVNQGGTNACRIGPPIGYSTAASAGVDMIIQIYNTSGGELTATDFSFDPVYKINNITKLLNGRFLTGLLVYVPTNRKWHMVGGWSKV